MGPAKGIGASAPNSHVFCLHTIPSPTSLQGYQIAPKIFRETVLRQCWEGRVASMDASHMNKATSLSQLLVVDIVIQYCPWALRVLEGFSGIPREASESEDHLGGGILDISGKYLVRPTDLAHHDVADKHTVSA